MGVLLRTDRLLLRPWTTSAGDLARLTDIYSREEITRWVGGTPSVPPAELVARWAQVTALDERYGCWAIECADSSIAGTVLFKPLPNGVGEVEVGWHLHPDSWGHGYATEAGHACLDYGFDVLGLAEIVAITAVGNHRSRAVMHRLGMTYDPADDFEDPTVDGPLRHSVLYRSRPSGTAGE